MLKLLEFIGALIGAAIIGMIKMAVWFLVLSFIIYIISEIFKTKNKEEKKPYQNFNKKKDDAIDIKAWETYWTPQNHHYRTATNKAKSQASNYQSNQYGKGETTRFKRPDIWEEWEKTKQKETKPQEPEKIVWNKEFLMSIEWKLFEDVCVEYLKTRKCNASVTNIGKDNGIDLKVKNNNGELMFIGQCKAWSRPVDVKEIRELYGIMAAENASDGFYITTSTFTKVAKEFKRGKRILLIDGDECLKRFNELDEASKAQIDKIVRVNDFNVPTCVNCNIKMTKRISQKPHNKGNEFWGCRNYPICKNTLQIRKNQTPKYY